MLCEYKDGIYYIHSPNMPEAYADGKTYDEAIRNVEEVLELTIQQRIKDGEDIDCGYVNPVDGYVRVTFLIHVVYDNKTWYLINPYLMYCGKRILLKLPMLFKELGYVSKESDERAKKKKVEHR